MGTELFVNRYTVTDEMLWECDILGSSKRSSLVCSAVFVLSGVACALLGFTGSYLAAAFAGALSAAAVIASASIAVLEVRRRRHLLYASGSEPGHEVTVWLGERIHVKRGSASQKYSWEQIGSVTIFHSFLVLNMDCGDAVVLARDGFMNGGNMLFFSFLREKRPDLNIKVIA